MVEVLDYARFSIKVDQDTAFGGPFYTGKNFFSQPIWKIDEISFIS